MNVTLTTVANGLLFVGKNLDTVYTLITLEPSF